LPMQSPKRGLICAKATRIGLLTWITLSRGY